MITITESERDRIEYMLSLVMIANYQLKNPMMDNSNLNIIYDSIRKADKLVVEIHNSLYKKVNND